MNNAGEFRGRGGQVLAKNPPVAESELRRDGALLSAVNSGGGAIEPS